MTAKNTLSKFRNRPGPTNFSFRFNPAEEDLLEEYSSTTNDSNTLSSSTTNLSLDQSHLSSSPGKALGEDVDDEQPVNSLSASSSQSEVGSQTPQSEKSSRDASPLKESIREGLPKVGRRSASLDYSSDGERWTLSGIKGRIAKRIEEIGKDAGSLYREKPKQNGVMNKIAEQSPSDGHVSKSFSSRSRSSLDVRAGLEDDEASSLTPVKKERDRSLSVEEGIDCAEETTTPVEIADLSLKDNFDPPKESSQLTKRSTVSLVASGAQALLTRNKSPKRASKVLPSQSSLPGDFVSLSGLKSTPSFESELLAAEDVDSSWEFINSDVATEEKPETPLVFEKPFVQKLSDIQPKSLFGKFSKSLKIYMPCKANSFELQRSHKNHLISILVAIFALQVVPISSYWIGLLTGFLLSYIFGSILWYVLQPSSNKKPLEIPDYQSLPPLRIPVDSDDKETSINKGWMNELPTPEYSYDPENYHMNYTQSVYVRLDGIQLRLSRPKVNIPKRAMWNEPKINAIFIRQRHFTLKGAKVTLPPEGLVRKRLWSKKYPICIVIPSEPQTLGTTSSWPVIQSSFDHDEECHSAHGGTSSDDEKPSKPCTTLYLFARTCREKEEWFRRFQAASEGKTLSQFQKDYCQNVLLNLSIDKASSELADNIENQVVDSGEMDQGPGDYFSYMARFISQDCVAQNVSNIRSTCSNASAPSQTESEKPTMAKEISTSDLWLNAIIGRIFYDFLTHSVWSKVIAEKIQRKLSVIRVPYFMDELKLRDINLGGDLPLLHRSSPPMIDERGLWIDFDLTYKGSFQMTLETKLNLMRLKRDTSIERTVTPPSTCPEEIEQPEMQSTPPLHHSKSFYNSDEEDSAESSSDEDISVVESTDHAAEDGSPSVPSSPSLSSSMNKASTSKKFLHWVDKITQSRYFQQATEIGYIKKAMAGVSKTPIILTVEVRGLVGTMVFNIPPPPSDRLWYGFRGNPQLSLVACPKLGEHVVTITHVTDWIEKKLTLEFQKLLVMPNMDDLIVPIMEPGPLGQQSKT